MSDDVTEQLLTRSGRGDPSASAALLEIHRERLRRMVAWRMDPRVSARVDPSDVVQETLIEASQKMPEYLRERPVPFYPWLRRMAWQRLVKLHEFHMHTAKRTVTREVHRVMSLPDHSSQLLVNQLVDSQITPSQSLMKDELVRRLHTLLGQLPPRDFEVLAMHYIEQMSRADIAAALEISVSAVNMRHMRAIVRIRTLMEEDRREGD